eukprot:TRINITY_DN14311_c0_g1_i1.p1 TRINITY_DN14311_c0_g1~~TRINITY_DN14311_c0_g1_i1.p1  ORF type:complete len:627 (-),score=97.70 TRINITY_DN14311_c0_g1_i1:96-1940(-)
MFRASDIFGRRAGSVPERPGVITKDAGNPPRSTVSSTTLEWDPATGKYVNEELPADIQQLMGIKRPKKDHGLVKAEQNAWSQPRKPQGKALGPSAAGLAPGSGSRRAPAAADVDTSQPSVEYKGFSKVDLNDRYYEKADVHLHGRHTYWNADATFFVYWQGDVRRWSICDAASLFAVRAGQYPGWAYQENHGHISQASGWMEAWNGEWREPALEVAYRSSSSSPPQWEDQRLQKAVSIVEFRGFAMKELNAKYYLRASEHIQGRPSFWDESGVYFIYWQHAMKRWAICDLKCLEAVKEGQCPGWAYRSDSSFLANACGWLERRNDEWSEAILETSVIGVCTKGLKVEFWGFSKEDLNTTFAERPEEEVQGRVTYWDPSDTYFLYWQSSMLRWAICDRASLDAAKSGLAPGWAYRTDSQHFTRSRGWMEVWGRDWRKANVTCTLLEGSVRDDYFSAVKAEFGEDAPHSAERYAELIRAVYEQKNPSKLDDVPKLLKKYQGREHELYEHVCAKYGAVAEEVRGEAVAGGEDAQEDEADGEELPELSAEEYAIHVQDLYMKHNPKKVADMGALLAKYRQNERQLYIDVCEKYGELPGKYHSLNRSRLRAQTRVKAEG